MAYPPKQLDLQPLDLQPLESQEDEIGEIKGNTFLDTISQYLPSGDIMRSGAAMGIRGLSGLVPGGPWGAAAGGIGEALAQTIEPREHYNFWQIPTQAAIGFVPFGKSATIGRGLAKGAAMGAGAATATHIADTGELPGLTDLALPAAVGAVGGGVGAKFGPKVGKEATVVGKEAQKVAPKLDLQTLAGELYDPYAAIRAQPVGTVMNISPSQMNKRTLANMIKLGFDYQEINEKGRIILKKVRESPKVDAPEVLPNESSLLGEVINFPRTVMASEDMSAPLRQGLGLIHKKEFWKALPDMFRAFGSEEAYKGIQADILKDPLFKKRVTVGGKLKPSLAEEVGLKLTDLNSMGTREESMLSKTAEKYIPGIRRSNRAYTAFLNKVRADSFRQMLTDFDAYSGMQSKNNLPLMKDIAGFINNASGRGSLGPLENSAKILSSALFSPRLIASRLQMMGRGGAALFSPEVYMLSKPSIRREYLKSLFAIAAVGGTFGQLAKLAGGTVESDMASSDFGKIKIGNTRIDPFGGFQQYIVAAQRLMPHLDLSSMGLGEIGGRMKSTTTGREYDLTNPKFGQSSQADVLLRFMRSKTNPIINFGWGLLAGQRELSGKPMDLTTANPMENAIAQRFIPMLFQDIYDLVQDQETPGPAKGLAAFLASFGMGSQTYESR